MKGIIVEKKGRKSVVMSNDGRFMTIPKKRKNNIGDEITFPSPAARTARIASMAAIFVLVMALSLFGVYAANSYTVNLDVNPSIEIKVSAFNNVSEITALNDDAEAISDLQSLVGLKFGTAVNQAILILLDEGYLDEDGTVVLSVEGNNNKVRTVTKSVSESVANANVESEQEDNGGNGKVGEDGMNIYIGRITQEIVEAAEKYDIPYGRALLVAKANEEGSDIAYEAAAVLSIREIQRIRNIAKTVEKLMESEEANNGNGNPDSSGQSNQTKALNNKLYKEAARIEDYVSELSVLVASGDADEDTIAEHTELLERLESIYSQFEDANMGTYQEIKSEVANMAENKGQSPTTENNGKGSEKGNFDKSNVSEDKGNTDNENDEGDTEDSDNGHGNDVSEQGSENSGNGQGSNSGGNSQGNGNN